MNRHYLVNLILFLVLISLTYLAIGQPNSQKILPSDVNQSVLGEQKRDSYWFILYRISNQEKLFFGEPGNETNSSLLKEFKVKSGVPGQKPTPLPALLGREYWIIESELETFDSPETAPYFLTLDVPVTNEEPFGPTPYLECNGQCNWEIPGAFGLHGVAGEDSRLSDEDPGSSGCIRHKDEDIIYLYNLLDPNKEEIRYYVKDS